MPKAPNFESILKSKRDFYGNTEAAIHFAAEQYAREYHNYILELKDYSITVQLEKPLIYGTN
jgi:hypothetical protein